MLPPLDGPQQYGDHFALARIYDYGDVAELMNPVCRRVTMSSTVGLTRLCRTAENLLERESDFCRAIRRVGLDHPTAESLETLP